jgi:hypothetical protein
VKPQIEVPREEKRNMQGNFVDHSRSHWQVAGPPPGLFDRSRAMSADDLIDQFLAESFG